MRTTGLREPAPAAQPATASLPARIAGWAARTGLPTPRFGLARQVLRPAAARLRAELAARVSYATKANPHPLVLRELEPLVDEFNVTNLAHLDQLRALGVAPHRIAWVNPVLTAGQRDAVLAAGVRRFVVDDQRGVDLLAGCGARLAVTLRLRPPDAGESARSVVRFGTTADALRRLAYRVVARVGMALEGISFFVGTHGAGMGQAQPFRRGIEAVASVCHQLDRDGIPVPAVNIGGGFPGSRRRFHRDHPEFFHRIRAGLDRELGGVPVICEPGRYFAEPTLVMLTRVIADRVIADRRLVHVDASGYAGLFESTFVDRGQGLSRWVAGGSGPERPAALLGPVMDSFDVLQPECTLPALAEGELLMLPNVGAYAIGYTTGCEGLRAPELVVLPEEIGTVLSEEWFA